MSYKITFSTVAIDDIGKMTNDVYIACMDKKTTEEYVRNFFKKIYDKSVFPESGTPLLFLKQATGYRYIIYKSYLAFYRIKGNEIIVERVLFAKSNYFNDLIIEGN